MRKVLLSEDEMPTHWYNILPDLPEPLPPPLHPITKEPVKPEDLKPIFPKELIRQEFAEDRWIRIPEEVREVYALWRPTPLIRAVRLERALKNPPQGYTSSMRVQVPQEVTSQILP